MKKGQWVKINRNQLATGMAEFFGQFIMWNAARVSKVDGDRVAVKWSNGQEFWFNSDQLEQAVNPKATWMSSDKVTFGI